MKRIAFRRKREGKTDYRKRIKLVLSQKPRLVVRRSLNNFTAQLIEYSEKGDITLASAHSRELLKFGYNMHRGNARAAYLTAYLCALKAIKKGYKEAILDIGAATPVKGSNIFAALKGAVDAGLNIPHSDEVLPGDERLKGVEEFVKKINKKFEEKHEEGKGRKQRKKKQ